MARGADARPRRPRQRRPLGGRVHGRDAPARWQWSIEAWTDRWATWHDELRRKVDADLDEDLSGEISEGVMFLEKALASVQGRRARSRSRTRSASSATPTRRSSRSSTSRSARSSSTAMEEAQEREGATHAREADHGRGRPRQGPLQRLVRAVPALLGRPQGRRGARPRHRRPRLRRPLPAAVPPDRRQEPQGPQQLARPPARTIPARRTRSAARRAATSPSTRSSAPSRTSATCAPPPTSTAWTSRSTSRSTPPPTTRG